MLPVAIIYFSCYSYHMIHVTPSECVFSVDKFYYFVSEIVNKLFNYSCESSFIVTNLFMLFDFGDYYYILFLSS